MEFSWTKDYPCLTEFMDEAIPGYVNSRVNKRGGIIRERIPEAEPTDQLRDLLLEKGLLTRSVHNFPGERVTSFRLSRDKSLLIRDDDGRYSVVRTYSFREIREITGPRPAITSYADSIGEWLCWSED